ncbi:NAD(P)/FAD-dependent oxidoreductase [Gallaecimonas mangrovi]|uniref:NAD(P)/FAD-dependent oxidoreductase n=1 Tax=Gallaecimonas mangrovi TaxID=2291597 RepID=UPI000E1FBD8F|nr:FAD-binding oxidoreductase [Gallaecimonas mangrovi]
MPIRYPSSYYAATAPITARPALSDKRQTQVCVLGGGFSGLSTALHLLEKGFEVIVLEAAGIGFGASGRNGGQMVHSYSRDLDVIEKSCGMDTARAMGEMAFEGNRIIRQRIEKYGIECDLKDGGAFVALNPRQRQGLSHHQALWQRYGYQQLELLEKDRLGELVDSPRYEAALLDHGAGHLHPLKLALGQARAIESLGGQIFEQSAVTQVDKGAKVRVHTASGLVEADYLVVAGNAYLGNLLPPLASKAMPCGTQIVTTEPLDASLAQSLIPNGYCIEDCNYLLDYYRLTADNRLLYGGGVTYGGGDPANIEAAIRPNLEATFPQLKGVKLDYHWGGDFLLTLNRLPQLGRLDSNIFYAQGYSGHGVTTTHLAGKVLAEAIAGASQRFDVFASLPHLPFPGGRALRVPLTALGAFWYSLRDKAGF